ncbi:GNAT family N-acetyltransferase [Companilactobacillus hulinensis]|uniref:GNAT family N-acetyltransferase n=1 Tax=Companilactobacillus hulinensis TaxID=2486007 RepID=UPI000F79B285|nr:GNAT family N-acetyltransferase [Companilactobacillus hulinensis]
MEIRTDRLIIRDFEESDIDAIYKIFSDPIVNQYLPWYPLENVDDTKVFFNNRIENNNGYFMAICLKEGNTPIGYIDVDSGPGHDFGYGLLKAYWSQGIVTEAGIEFIKYLKSTDIPFVTATHDVNNFGSGKVMQKLGMDYQYSYEELWQPKNFLVTFRMYQLNFKSNIPVYEKYWNMYQNHFIENIEM